MNHSKDPQKTRVVVTEIVYAIRDLIRDLGSVPSGHLYARLMGHMDLEGYNAIIATLVRAGVVREHPSHLLEWIGPEEGRPSEPNQKPEQKDQTDMNASIAANATAKSILAAHKPPRGATHFRFTTEENGGRKPIIDKIQNIDTLAGCAGKLEFGKATYEGRGRHAKIKEFSPIAAPSEIANADPAPRAAKAKPRPKQTAEKAQPSGEPSKGRKNKILGHSACAIAKALGSVGVRFTEADKIMRANGVVMSKASLSVQLGFGRNKETWAKRGMPADLTIEEIDSLRLPVA